MKYFDGYDPATNSLIDAKAWNNYPPGFLMDQEMENIENDALIAKQNGSSLELRVSSPQTTQRLAPAIEDAGIANVVVRYWPNP